MKQFTLEICADSFESAKAAWEGGADRIELCQNLIIGGTTPSPYLFRQIREKSPIRIHVLIRPRFGDFLYSEEEIQVMEEEIKMYREMGAEGVVIGAFLILRLLQADEVVLEADPPLFKANRQGIGERPLEGDRLQPA